MPRFIIFSIVVMALFTLGCRRSNATYPATPHMNSKRFAKLRRLASQEMLCNENKLAHAYRGTDEIGEIHEMRGCGRRVRYILACGGICRWIRPLSKKQVAKDLRCSQNNIRLEALNAKAYGARGCGREGIYKLSMMGRWKFFP